MFLFLCGFFSIFLWFLICPQLFVAMMLVIMLFGGLFDPSI